MELSIGLRTRFGGCGNSSIGLLHPALLDYEVLFIFCELLLGFQISQLRPQSLLNEISADLLPFLNEWTRRTQLSNRGSNSCTFGLFLSALAFERSDLSPMFVDLFGEKFPL